MTSESTMCLKNSDKSKKGCCKRLKDFSKRHKESLTFYSVIVGLLLILFLIFASAKIKLKKKSNASTPWFNHEFSTDKKTEETTTKNVTSLISFAFTDNQTEPRKCHDRITMMYTFTHTGNNICSPTKSVDGLWKIEGESNLKQNIHVDKEFHGVLSITIDFINDRSRFPYVEGFQVYKNNQSFAHCEYFKVKLSNSTNRKSCKRKIERRPFIFHNRITYKEEVDLHVGDELKFKYVANDGYVCQILMQLLVRV